MPRARDFAKLREGKVLQTDYDYVFSLIGECSVCLTNQQIQWVLDLIDYAGWATRWTTSIDTEIDQQVINSFRDDLARRLMAGCQDVEPRRIRYTPDGIFQVFNPNTGLWEDRPEEDPRLGAPDPPLIPGSPGDAIKCAGADNVRDAYANFRDQIILVLDGGALVSGIIAALIGLLGVFLFATVVGTAWGIIIWTLAAFLYDLGSAGVSAQLTAAVMEDFKCILYCRIEDDGTFAPESIPLILDDINAKFVGFPNTFFYQITAAMGHKGLTASAAAGVSTADDCEDCLCGDDNCGFTTTGTLNKSRWSVATEKFDPAYWGSPIEADYSNANLAVFAAGGNTLASYTEFEEPCYITEVSLFTAGRGNQNHAGIAYKTTLGGAWVIVLQQQYASWAAGVAKVGVINAPVMAIQVQSAANQGQNNFNTIVIADTTP